MILIDSNLCKGCDICIVTCPKNVYTKSVKINKKNVYIPYAANLDSCVGCKLCEISCPDQAIYVNKEVNNG